MSPGGGGGGVLFDGVGPIADSTSPNAFQSYGGVGYGAGSGGWSNTNGAPGFAYVEWG